MCITSFSLQQQAFFFIINFYRNIVVYKISGDKQIKNPANLKKDEYRDCKGDGIHKA